MFHLGLLGPLSHLPIIPQGTGSGHISWRSREITTSIFCHFPRKFTMSLYAYQIKVKLRRLNPHLCLLESLRSAQWSPCVRLHNRNSSCYLRPCPLPLLASGWGQTRGVCLYHGHICLPGLTDVSVGKLGCCQLRGFPFGLLIFTRTLLQSSGNCGNILFKNPTRQNLEAPYIRPLSYCVTGGAGVSGPGPPSPN